MNPQILKSKSFWAGLGSIVAGIGLIVQGDAAQGVQLIATGVVAIFIRDAIANK